MSTKKVENAKDALLQFLSQLDEIRRQQSDILKSFTRQLEEKKLESTRRKLKG